MWDEGIESNWSLGSEVVIVGMKEWRERHPGATLVEIEEALDGLLAKARARLPQDVVLASDAKNINRASEDERFRRPQCGSQLESRGEKVRKLSANYGQSIELKRSHGACPACKTGIFPPWNHRGRGTGKRGARSGPVLLFPDGGPPRPALPGRCAHPRRRHAAEYLAKARQAAFGAGTTAASEWLGQQLHQLKHGEPEEVLHSLRDLCRKMEPSGASGDDGAVKTIKGSLEYLEKRNGHPLSFAARGDL